MNKTTYEVYQVIAHLLTTRSYTPQEFNLFATASHYLGACMKEYEDGVKEGEDSSEGSTDPGAEVPDSAAEA